MLVMRTLKGLPASSLEVCHRLITKLKSSIETVDNQSIENTDTHAY